MKGKKITMAVTRAQAEAALRKFKIRYARDLEGLAEDSSSQPRLYEPGFHADGWVIAWEGGPDDWSVRVSEPVKYGGLDLDNGRGRRRLEPLNNWSVGIYES